MEAKTRQHYWAPTSQVFTIQPVKILNNSQTDYNHGSIDEMISPFLQPALESLPEIPTLP